MTAAGSVPPRTPPRLRLVHAPTPLVRYPRLSDRLGIDLWVKRDDASSGVEAGNKIRKLEHLFADAEERGADTVLTCGALQSNHCRATAVVAARLGLKSVVFLRTSDVTAKVPNAGNALLMKMVGADIHLISAEDYRRRDELLATAAETLRRAGRAPYIIPEGGSNGLGAFGYVEAMREIRAQLDLGISGGKPFDLVVHACGSGGTAAGAALGASAHDVAREIMAVAVCDDRAYFERVTARIVAEARALSPRLGPPAKLVIDDRWKGPAYGKASAEQRRFIVDMAREHGLLLDPVYTGKALFGLAGAVAADPELLGQRVLFLHTGGLPGLLAEGEALEGDL
jgi:D-cysteine desulfhydrase